MVLGLPVVGLVHYVMFLSRTFAAVLLRPSTQPTLPHNIVLVSPTLAQTLSFNLEE